VLIVGALALRRSVLDDDADDPPTGSTVATTIAPSEAGELVCATELAAVCRAVAADHPELAVRVEDAGTTLDALAALPDGEAAPLWVTIQPYPAMVDTLRGTSRQPLAATVEPLGASQLAIASPDDGRADVLVASCATDPLWSCIGRWAGTPWTDIGGEAAWRTVRPSLGIVERDAVALASFAAAVAGYFGTPQVSRNTWEADPAFVPWLRRLAGAVDESVLSGGTPLATMATRAGSLDIAATTDAELAGLGGDRFAVNYPEPSMWVEAVLAVPDGAAAPDGLAAEAAAALAAAGWGAADTAAASVPGASTMIALRELWRQAT
jgi:hypothetical protein